VVLWAQHAKLGLAQLCVSRVGCEAPEPSLGLALTFYPAQDVQQRSGDATDETCSVLSDGGFPCRNFLPCLRRNSVPGDSK
jgi:hypothetical protein